MKTLSTPFKSLSIQVKKVKSAVLGKRKDATGTPMQHEVPEDTPALSDSAMERSADMLSAQEFAQAVGLEAILNDDDDDMHQSTILSTLDSEFTNYLTIQSLPTSPISARKSSFPRLDMNIFVPPGQETSRSLPRSVSSSMSAGSTCYSFSSSLESDSLPGFFNRPPKSMARRASDTGYLSPSSHTRSSTPPSLSLEGIDEFGVKTAKKGRFTMTVERSSHWYANKSPRHRTTSRFSVVDELAASPSRERSQSAPLALDHPKAQVQDPDSLEERRDSGVNI
ncbi:hypothetical protein HDU91_007418 [Kappamyces sp. JEL0680]|nr:hypothetical protein HDU91_007418 [Kappamyces sp. JEL0680]